MKIPVLIYQMDVQFGEPLLNLQKIEKMLDSHEMAKGAMVVLPELFLTGYHKSSIEKLSSRGEYEELRSLMEISKSKSISIFGSLPYEIDDKCFNTAMLIQKGEIVTKYPKSHLFGPMGEKDLFSPGRDIITYNFGSEIRIGLSICYDLRFPELYRTQSKFGSNLFLICAEWPIQRIEHWEALLRARAIENQATVIACNRVGEDPDYKYGGSSMVINSFGDEVVSAKHDKETVIQVTLRSENLTSFREKFDTSIDKWV